MKKKKTLLNLKYGQNTMLAFPYISQHMQRKKKNHFFWPYTNLGWKNFLGKKTDIIPTMLVT